MTQDNIVLSGINNAIEGDTTLRIEVDQTLNVLKDIPEFQGIMAKILQDRPGGLKIITGDDPLDTHIQGDTIFIDRDTFQLYYRSGVPDGWKVLNSYNGGTASVSTITDQFGNDVTSTFINDNITQQEIGYTTSWK